MREKFFVSRFGCLGRLVGGSGWRGGRGGKKAYLRGFTLIELLVVVTIISLLAGAGFVSYINVSRNSRNAKRLADLEQVRASLELYRTENGVYPTGPFSSMVDALFAGRFISKSEVSDPKDTPGSSYWDYTYDQPGNLECTGFSYRLCYRQEPEETQECLCSP